MNWLKNGIRFVVVTVGVIALTSIGIDASQYLSGSQSALGILVDEFTQSDCPIGMIFVENGVDDFCIDKYEVTVGSNCPIKDPAHSSQTADNIKAVKCQTESVEEKLPWTNVTYHQAVELCAKSYKRLPTQSEWYKASLGTNESECLVSDNSVQSPTKNSDCISSIGAVNMVGNVWEWVSGDVIDGIYNNRKLPDTGYVSNADSSGVATETTNDPQANFHNDYFWASSDGTKALMRGGYYGSGEDAGIYSIHADIELNFSGSAIGFRCAIST